MSKVPSVIHGHVLAEIMPEDSAFPNNRFLPLLVYKGALHLHPNDEAGSITELFERNNWSNCWKDSVYDYHHYHSNTHEVLGVFCGKADLQFGGPEGISVELVRGDVVVIPAGVAHKSLFSTDDFLCIGAYPNGAEYDMNFGREGERPKVDDNIAKVPLPQLDPVLGDNGPLQEYWLTEKK